MLRPSRDGDRPAEDPRTGPEPAAPAPIERGSAWEVFLVAARLGVISFGGPVAHLGYFRTEYVERRRWLDERTYADLIALAQFLPGAASSKLGMSIGILRTGLKGGLAAWLGFTLPSAIALAVAAGLLRDSNADTIQYLHGLKVVAVAVVAQAVWGMAKSFAFDRNRASIAIAAAAAVLLLPTSIGQISVIAVAGVIGWRFLRVDATSLGPQPDMRIPRWLGAAAWVALFGLLAVLPIARGIVDWHPLAMFDSFFRSGSLVFGGGHVVLPLLRAEVVPPHWIGQNQFLAGYGLAQAVPGPLFTFSSYLGAAMRPTPNGALGATVALVAIFLPSMLITIGSLPWWGALRRRVGAQAALRGISAAVVGVLLAALYNPVWTSAIMHPRDFVLALVAFGLLVVWKLPPWVVVVVTGGAGALMAVWT